MNTDRPKLSPLNAKEIKKHLLGLSYPSTCSWKVEITEVGDKNEDDNQPCEVVLSQKWTTFSLNLYMSSGKWGSIFLSESKKMEEDIWVSWLEKDVILSKKIIENPIFLIILLHEIWHTRTKTTTKDIIIQALQGWIKSKDIYKWERSAWSEAIKIIRDLWKKGIKIEEWISWKDINNLMTYALLSYEYKHDPEGKESPIILWTRRKVFEIVEY